MQVSALYRHPIKSHGRERVEAFELIEGQTVPWDRTWAVTHEASKVNGAATEWASYHNFQIGTRTPRLAGIWAKLDESSRQVTLEHRDLGEITFRPDDASDAARFIAWIKPLCPDNRAQPVSVVSAGERGMTDSTYPSVSIMTDASHHAMATAMGGFLEAERWRGNIWLDGAGAWEEFDWVGKDIEIGEAVLRIEEPINRCPHTQANPMTGERDADTLGTLERHFGHQDFGVYATVIRGGRVALGDGARLS